MCFSATASFTAAGGLLSMFAYLNISARSLNATTIYSSILILAFAAQQTLEGIEWLAFAKNNFKLMHICALIHMFFGIWFWSVFNPLICLVNEPQSFKRKIFVGLAITGMIFGAYVFIPLVINPRWLHVSVIRQCISYDPQTYFLNNMKDLHIAIYMLCSVVPQILSSFKTLRYQGFLWLIGLILARYFYVYAQLSVWCFFVAMFSLIILRFEREVNNYRSASSNSLATK